MQAEEEKRGEEERLVQQGQVLVLLQHQLNHNQAQREEEVDQEVLQNRGRRTAIGVAGRGRETGVAATATDVAGRGRGTATGVVGRGRGTGVAVTTTDVPGATRGGKRPRMVRMGILHTHSDFTIHNVIIENLGHHKPRSGLKWKGKANVTQQGLQEMRENKRMRTRSNAAKLSLFEIIMQPVLHYFYMYNYAVVPGI
ncbi:hypothetical protein R3W88_004972 [Solanum pinnatisectum]|uniref:Uncharacterized protein n=1 Tax=Solanum pinnatisectum TaxID=50273 RepID=A0AAV9KAW8_9SOLN|nr:hypothetical protein R3W88_004972 [Solanum pinnatisectum]